MQYRAIKEKDAEFLAAIFSIPEYDLYFAENDTTAEDWIKRLEFFAAKHSDIISKDGVDVGWIMYSIHDITCEIDIIVLAPEERFKGYGKEIFKDLAAMHPQIKTIYLDVQQRNKHAVDFYKKMGFQIIGEEKQPVRDKEEPYYNMRLNM